MKRRFVAFLARQAAFVGLAAPGVALAGEADVVLTCGVPARESAAIVEITPRFEFRLDDGRLARLAGLAPTPPGFVATPAARALRERLVTRLQGAPVHVAAISGADRWGRLTAFLAPVTGGEELGLALLGAGAARLEDARLPGGCGPERLAAESRAREAGVGLWSEAYYRPLRADDLAGLLARAGEFVLVEGVVRRVGKGRRLIYLDFGPGRDGFSVTTRLQATRNFEAAGLTLTALAGRRLRVRGVIESMQTPRGPVARIEIAGPGAIEPLDRGGGGATQ